MPAKYHIHTEPAPPRLRPIGKLGIVEWREDCSSCHNCVKRSCVYGFYRDESDRLRDEVGYLDYIFQCKGCLNCVQDCTKGIITRVVNPEYELLGDDYYTPEIIVSTWYQAETGGIPVSGSGYGGPFSGHGFDSMWTDMSEIVRPTRDGIHGREYISLSVDIGRKLRHLSFEDGELNVETPPLLDNPMPIIFDIIPKHFQRGPLPAALLTAAAEIGSLVVMPVKDLASDEDMEQDCVVPLLGDGQLADAEAAISNGATTAAMVMLPDSNEVAAVRNLLKAKNPDQVVAVRLEATPEVAGRALRLAREGAEVVHLVFDSHGCESGTDEPRHMRDVLRDVHGLLTREGVRDEITLSVSGGIAQAEHVAKALICGADFVAIDLPLLVALECRLCGACEIDGVCPIAMNEVDTAFATRRIVNLMAAWCNQLIELLGAMGIREARRLRGETGRCMFFEDLEADTFGRLFGKLKTRDPVQ